MHESLTWEWVVGVGQLVHYPKGPERLGRQVVGEATFRHTFDNLDSYALLLLRVTVVVKVRQYHNSKSTCRKRLSFECYKVRVI